MYLLGKVSSTGGTLSEVLAQEPKVDDCEPCQSKVFNVVYQRDFAEHDQLLRQLKKQFNKHLDNLQDSAKIGKLGICQ